jgi:localization factor PodJL
MDIGTTPLRASPPAATERRPIDPNLPPDHPLEPGVARGRQPLTPADRIAASEAAISAVKPPVIQDPGGKSNFIAAARRAAQAASEAPVRTTRATEAVGSKPAVTPTMFPSLIRRHARSLIIGASVLAIVLGSINIVVNWLADEPKGGGINRPTVSSPVNGDSAASSHPTKEPAPVPTPPAPERQSSLTPATAFSPPSSVLTPAPSAIAAEATGAVVPPETTPVPAPRPAPATVATPAAPVQTATAASSGENLPEGIGGSLRAAAAKGDPAAQYEIALRFADGRGMPQNLNAAAQWFERAAKQGLAPAQFRLGGLYEKGLGVKKDLDAARRYYALAGEAGNAKALHNLAVLYAEGMDGKPDYQTAAQWFRKAAAFGMADSQYNLGVLYARGIGVEQNLTEAYRWFGLAARGGDKESERKRDELVPRLDQQSLRAAGQAIDGFKPEAQPEAASQVKVPAGGWDPVPASSVPPANKRRSSTPGGRQEAAVRLDFSTPSSAQ